MDKSVEDMVNKIVKEQNMETYKLSRQFMGVMAQCLLKCLAEEIDVMVLLQDLDVYLKDGELFVDNPPSVKIDPSKLEENSDELY